MNMQPQNYTREPDHRHAGPVTQDRAELAVQWLLDNAGEIAKAKAQKEYCEDRLRVVKAIAMSHSSSRTQSAKECDAYASPQYRSAIHEKRQAVMAYELLMNDRFAAQTLVDLWRSINSNLRAAGV